MYFQVFENTKRFQHTRGVNLMVVLLFNQCSACTTHRLAEVKGQDGDEVDEVERCDEEGA